MSDQTGNIFNTQGTPENSNTGGSSNTQPDNNGSFEDLLKNIQNERGEAKYRDVPSALEGLRNAQSFIEQLKNEARGKDNELTTLKAELEKLRAVQESLDRIGQSQGNAPQNNAEVFTPEKLHELVNNAIAQRETKAAQASNIKKVTDTLTSKFGDKAEEQFYSKARELGFSPEDFNALAAKSPSAVLQLFGASQNARDGFVPINRSTFDTNAYTPTPETFVKKNDKKVTVGATTQELNLEMEDAKKMVEELHQKGESVHNLTDPKVYFKYFG